MRGKPPYGLLHEPLSPLVVVGNNHRLGLPEEDVSSGLTEVVARRGEGGQTGLLTGEGIDDALDQRDPLGSPGLGRPKSGAGPSPPHLRWARSATGFCDPKVDAKIETFRTLADPRSAAAGQLWAKIERRIVDQAAMVPLVNNFDVHLVSDRVGNFQAHPHWLVLVGQLWVR